MEESIQNRIIVVLAILSLIFFIGTVNSCSSASRQRGAFSREMSARLDLEEKMSKLAQEKIVLEERLKERDNQLEEEKSIHQATKKTLTQEQLVNKTLKEELQKITELKEALEEDLKEALLSAKSTKVHK